MNFALGLSDTLANVASTSAVTSNMQAIDAKDADVNVTITDGTLASGDIADLNAVATATNGVVTATLSDTLANLSTLDTGAGDAITVTATSTTNAAADLIALDAKTSVEVVATAMTTITGSAANVKAVTITADVANSISTDSDYLVTLDDTTVAASALSEIDSDTTGAVTVTSATTITGTAAEVLVAAQSTGILTATDYNATLSGTASTAQLADIDDDTSGTILAAAVSDTLTNISSFNASTGSLLTNATGTITATGDGNNDSVNFNTVGKAMTVLGLGGADNITGTAFNDTINGGTGIDSLFGGNGSDTFVFATGDSPTVLVSILSYDKIGDFVMAEDQIDLAVSPVLGGTDSQTVTLGTDSSSTVALDANGKITLTGSDVAGASMVEVLAAMRAVVTDAGEIGFLEFVDPLDGNSTFIYQENGSSSSDLFIQLTGITGIDDTSNLAGDANTLFIA